MTGVNIGDFGSGSNESFYDLIVNLDKINGIERFRISSIEPNLLSDRIIDFCTKSEKFMPHFHIPLQSGSDKILRSMGRRYDKIEFSNRIKKIKAIIPDVDTSRDLLPEVKSLLNGHEEDEILLYCTGGIRCEKASAYLIKNGFSNVNQLQGGIIQYAHDIKSQGLDSKFLGKNFVFDARMGERVTNDIIGECHQCGRPADKHLDCGNEACHILFIQCDKCYKEYDGCCTKECKDFASLPIEEQRILRKDPEKVVSQTRYSSRVKPKLTRINQS